ncbi:MAG: winged helix-turn-helix domain-containing protein [Chloroflexota bacterium]
MTNAPSAESLFKTLKAENEPWLGDVFVSLPAFERLREDVSTILYGEAGSGKTAMRLALTKEQRERIFNALWTPEPILETITSGTALAQQAMKQALSACAESLVLEGNLPQRLGESSSHIASALQWFLQNYLPFNAILYIQDQANRLPQDDLQWYLKLLEQPLPAVVKEGASFKDQIRLLLMILRAAKYERLWLTIDGIERWTPRGVGDQVEALLEAVLSTLVFFDLKEVSFKFFAPLSFKGALHKTSGVERYRSIETDLTWSVEALREMLEKRLACALSSKKASLASLSDGDEFLNWLKEYGGSSPRAWLGFTAPLVMEYQKRGKRLTSDQTREFILQHPAPLRLHRERREIWLGEKRITDCSTLEFRVLEYLSAHPGKITSLEELYYYAYKELNEVPDKGAPVWTHPKTWRGAMDNVLMRIRQKIEPDPKNPLYLVTHHGKGVELLHAET